MDRVFLICGSVGAILPARDPDLDRVRGRCCSKEDWAWSVIEVSVEAGTRRPMGGSTVVSLMNIPEPSESGVWPVGVGGTRITGGPPKGTRGVGE